VLDDILRFFNRSRRPGRKRKSASQSWRVELDQLYAGSGIEQPRRRNTQERAAEPARGPEPAYPSETAFQPDPVYQPEPSYPPEADHAVETARAREAPRRQEQRRGNGSAPPRPVWAAREAGPSRGSPRQGYLAAHSLEKSFGSRKVVKGTSLYVRRGEAVGLLGPNGAGKTTVFYMITGLIKADRGSIELDGYDVTALPMYQRARLGFGYLPQEA
jgi:lipopolysaccharide export system ATP-binding protein